MNIMNKTIRTFLVSMALAGTLAWTSAPANSGFADAPCDGAPCDSSLSPAHLLGFNEGSAAHDARCDGEPCDAVLRGLRAFFDRDLRPIGGNGRSCADCHMPTDNFQLSPADVEARFQRLQSQRVRNPGADDPLFRPLDADDFRSNGSAAGDFSNLRENGLIRIVFPLPQHQADRSDNRRALD